MNRLLLILILVNGITFDLIAQCGPAGVFVDPLPVAICEGSSSTLNLSANGTCGGNYEFQITDGGTVVQPWGTLSTFDAAPITTTLFTVSVRCDACPATVISDTFSVYVTEQPDVSGDTLVCNGTATILTATGTAQSIEWLDAEVGGNQLSANGIYNTPPLTTDQTYWVHAGGTSGVGGGGSILITECGLAGFVPGQDNDYVEISNLYSTPVNTAGWKVAISNSYTNINSVNGTIWDLPNSFAPCSILSKTDDNGAGNYWGSNMLWNPNQPGWALILDDAGTIMDFVGWGWTAADFASFNPTVAGFSLTLGGEWVGASVPDNCGSTAAPESITRIGNNDNNDAGDFVCQPTSLNALNPNLTCGWSASASCPYPVNVIVDQYPTASNPLAINVECVADVPAPDIAVVTDESDDFTSSPTVTHIGDVSDGLSCPETITRTYRVADSCSNYVDVIQTITIQDITEPIMATAPVDVSVQCVADIPAMTNLGWTDNCDGSGSVTGVDVSDGNSCPETITRTWTYTDACGNVATTSQIIIVNDITPPTASNLPTQQLVVLPAADPSLVNDATDNCTSNPSVTWLSDVSDGGFCPEIVTRTYSVKDDCDNEIFVTQEFIIGDPIPNAHFSADPQVLSNLDTEVQFTNNTTGAVSYQWDFDDGSSISNEVNPFHVFPDEESGGYVVELVAFSPFGCTDTFTLVVQVQEEVVYFMPNSFTPDGDSHNQTWKPVFVSGYDPYDFNLFVFNRWGEIIWESHDDTVGWDGTYGGKLVESGTYQWKLEFKIEANDSRKVVSGHVNILR